MKLLKTRRDNPAIDFADLRTEDCGFVSIWCEREEVPLKALQRF